MDNSEEYSYVDWVTPKEEKSETSFQHPKPFSCHSCSAIFPNEFLLHQHLNHTYEKWHCGRCFTTFCSQQSLLDHDCPYWNNQGYGFVSQNPGNRYSPCPPPMVREHNMQNRPRPLMGGPIETPAANSWEQNMQNWSRSLMGNGFGSPSPGNQYSSYPSPVAREHNNIQNRPRPLMGVPIETPAANSWGQNMQNQPKSFVEELINVQASTLSDRNMPIRPRPLMAESVGTPFTYPQTPIPGQVQSWRTLVGLDPMPNYFCQNCNKYFKTDIGLSRHACFSNCNRCGVDFGKNFENKSDKEGLCKKCRNFVYAARRSAVKSAKKSAKTPKTKNFCDICKQSFRKARSLSTHTCQHICSKCGNRYAVDQNSEKDVTRMENGLCNKCRKADQPKKSKPRVFCQFCKKYFKKAKSLYIHQCGKSKLTCSKCEDSFEAGSKFEKNSFRKRNCLCGKCWKEHQVQKILASSKPNPNIKYEDDE